MQCVEHEFSFEIKDIQKIMEVLTPDRHTSACEARVGAIRVEVVLAAHTRVVVGQVDARGVRRAHLIGGQVAVWVLCRGINLQYLNLHDIDEYTRTR